MEEQKQAKVNWNFKNYFLTYPQATFGRSDLINFLAGLFDEYGVRRWVVSTEKHKDGGIHYHAIYCLLTKCHIRRSSHFDFQGRHPHVKSASTPDDLYFYVTKDGDYEGSWLELVVPTDFRKRKADIEAFRLEKECEALVSPFPITLPDKSILEEIPAQKKRHYWFVAKADWGKTAWVNEAFGGKKVFLRRAHNYPFEGYAGENCIVYDDVAPSGKEELCSVTNTWRVRCHVYGSTRYTQTYWGSGDRLVIILSNRDCLPEYVDAEWFIARFNVVWLQ